MRTSKGEILRLNLTGVWFDQISSGVKQEEYRELSQYWYDRLVAPEYRKTHTLSDFTQAVAKGEVDDIPFKPFTHCIAFNGYNKNSPCIEWEHLGTSIGKPRRGWCPDGYLNKTFFVLKIGSVTRK